MNREWRKKKPHTHGLCVAILARCRMFISGFYDCCFFSDFSLILNGIYVIVQISLMVATCCYSASTAPIFTHPTKKKNHNLVRRYFFFLSSE